MKLVVIGIGAFGRNHLRVLKELGHEVITCDLDESLNPDFLDYKDIDLYRYSIDDGIDATIIATIASTHYEIAKYFLENNCPVFVEKPMTLDYGQAIELIDIAEKNDVTFAVGHIFRYNSVTARLITELKRIYGEGQAILAIRAQRIGLHNPRLDCGVTFDYMIHDVDLIDYILRSACRERSDRHLSQGYDNGHIVKGYPLGTKNEDISSLNYTINKIFTQVDADWINPVKSRSLQFICSNETLEADFVKEQLTIHKSGLFPIPKEEGEWRFSTKMGDTIIPKISHEEPLKKELEDFLSCVKDGGQPISNARSCLAAIRLISSLVNNCVEDKK